MKHIGRMLEEIPRIHFPGLEERARERHPYLRFTINESVAELTYRVFNRAGIAKAEDPEIWNFEWGKQLDMPQYMAVKSFQKINHFAGAFLLGKKDNLHLRMKELGAKLGRIPYYPKSYLYPSEAALWAMDTEDLWIFKPGSSSKGDGIKLLRSKTDLDGVIGKTGVMQQYVKNPLLIDGKKFDLRLYVLVTSVSPLKIYLSKEGLVRFAAKEYDITNLDEMNRHLTNFAINRSLELKWTLDKLMNRLRSDGVDTGKLWRKISLLCAQTVIAGSNRIKEYHRRVIKHRNSSFELLGFDVLISDDYNPYLMEVNISPSMVSSRGDPDFEMKVDVISETMNMAGIIDCDPSVGCPAYDTQEETLARSLTEQRVLAVENWENPLESPVLMDEQIIKEFEYELSCASVFQCIYPAKSNASSLFNLIDSPDYSDRVLLQWVVSNEVELCSNKKAEG